MALSRHTLIEGERPMTQHPAYGATAVRPDIPSLPQSQSPEARETRRFQLSLARTEYNYMQSYLEGVPLSADLPQAEKFNPAYEAQVLQVFLVLSANFQRAVLRLLERELSADLPEAALQRVQQCYEQLKKDLGGWHPGRDIKDLLAFFEALAALPAALKDLMRLPGDLLKMASGLDAVFKDFEANGPTAFLKSTLYDMLNTSEGRDYLLPRSLQDYRDLMQDLPQPLMLEIARQDWMPATPAEPCEQDWFFGWLQTAGFNTTLLRAVVSQPAPGSQQMALAELLRKMPVSDALLRAELGPGAPSLAEAAARGRLFVVDYALLEGAWADKLNGRQRYLAAPIALFYWNPQPPAGYPPCAEGVLQPLAIQLAQQHEAESAPIFSPRDSAGANDAGGYKWQLAKHFVNVAAAIQHESIAHLGNCHLVIEPIVVAAHRQLAVQHPLLKLLEPHFRFTININDSAIHSLIVPGGVVACNVGPAIECTLDMLAKARSEWRWDENHPERLFALRGVERLQPFAFREDTLLLWRAIHEFVGRYLRLYYRSDADVRADEELQGFVAELVDPRYAGFQGLGGLVPSGDPKRPWRLESLDYLIEMVAQMIYIAGPQHASVNYAQYPLMSYAPSVTGSLYQPAPTRSTRLESEQDCLPWYPPLDLALYGLSFEYLLSGVQYDRLGQYEHNPRDPYFADPRVAPLVADFQSALSLAEIEIRKRNQGRPMPYPFQLPSQIPNSISI